MTVMDQILMAISMLLEYFMLTISVFFCSRLGEKEMAAITLSQAAISFICVVPGAGMMTVCNTYFSVGHGAKQDRKQGIFLQKAIFISIIAALLCCSILINIEDILLSFHQDPEILKNVGIYVRTYIPATQALFISLALSRLLQCRGKVTVTVLALLFSVVVDIFLNFLFVIVLEAGFRGSAVATVASQYVNLIILSTYVYKYEDLEMCSLKSLDDLYEFSSIALHGCITIEIGQLFYIICYILSGQFGVLYIDVFGAVELLILYLYMLWNGLCSAVTILVGQYLGQNEPRRAKIMMEISFILTWGIAFIISVILMTFRDYLGYIYTTDRDILIELSRLMPLFISFQIAAATVATSKAILQACGMQKIGTLISLICYSFIGLPLSVIFAFVLEWKTMGLSAGIFICDAVQAVALLPFILKLDFFKEAELAIERCRVSQTEEIGGVYSEINKAPIKDLSSHETEQDVNKDESINSESTALIDTSGTFKLDKKTIILRSINFIVPFCICFTSFVIYFFY